MAREAGQRGRLPSRRAAPGGAEGDRSGKPEAGGAGSRQGLQEDPEYPAGALPQPRSSRALAADTRAAAGAALEPQTPVSVRMASSVCARAKERISAVALAI